VPEPRIACDGRRFGNQLQTWPSSGKLDRASIVTGISRACARSKAAACQMAWSDDPGVVRFPLDANTGTAHASGRLPIQKR
jgi:hypothetical protein